MNSIISIDDLSKQEIITILALAKKIQHLSHTSKQDILKGSVIATLFFESSTRTKLSFESAVQQLGGQILSFDASSSSLTKGESFSDTIKMIQNYAEMLIIRHPLDGSSRLASMISKTPIINAGDGANQHPSQTLLDLFTIQEQRGTLDDLTIAFVGDLRFGRTVHSLVKALVHFKPKKLYLVAPEMLQMPKDIIQMLEKNGISYVLLDDFRSCMPEIDVFYMTRIQKERFPSIDDYNKIKGIYILNKSNTIGFCKEDMIIMHPLPRIDEIDTDLDDTQHAVYFKQAQNGIPVRQAMIVQLLNKKID